MGRESRFGQSSEKYITENQMFFECFNEAEILANPTIPEPEIEEIKYKRKKRKGKREAFFKDLPTEQIIHELPVDEQICSVCGGNLHACGHSVLRREIEIVPAKIKVVKTHSKSYKNKKTIYNDPSE